MLPSLKQILGLAGRLDDAPGENTPRERFRQYVVTNVPEIGQVRDFIVECLSSGGEQSSRALQDLINHIGRLLGFEVAFGRYNGGKDEIGFDGLWRSPTGLSVVIEVKSSETYPIKTTTLLGYVDELIAQGRVTGWETALGLYVIGKPDPEVRQLHNAILVEKRTHQHLRTITVEGLLSLAEMVDAEEASHEDILAILRPSAPAVDPVVELLARLMANRVVETLPAEKVETLSQPSAETDGPSFWLAPVGSNGVGADETIRTLVGDGKVYALGDRSPARKQLKSGDRICFYACGLGVVADAAVAGLPEKGIEVGVPVPPKYPWIMRLSDVRLYLDDPKTLDGRVRAELDAFAGRNPEGSWGWFLQMTHRLTPHDFQILTRRG